MLHRVLRLCVVRCTAAAAGYKWVRVGSARLRHAQAALLRSCAARARSVRGAFVTGMMCRHGFCITRALWVRVGLAIRVFVLLRGAQYSSHAAWGTVRAYAAHRRARQHAGMQCACMAARFRGCAGAVHFPCARYAAPHCGARTPQSHAARNTRCPAHCTCARVRMCVICMKHTRPHPAVVRAHMAHVAKAVEPC